MNEKEKKVVSLMIRIYCRSQHQQRKGLCSACEELNQYAHERLERCPYKETKPVCKKCPVHCYKPLLRQKIQEVMRYAGPRMLFYHPGYAVWYLKKSRKQD